MDFLSLQEPVEAPALRVGRSEAVLLSIGLHLLVLVLFLFAPGVISSILPQSVITFLSPRPPVARAAPVTIANAAPGVKQPDTQKIPLKFTYVSVPHDEATAKNPNAPLFSDKNRRARQETPTPPDARKFSIDPHSEGTSIDRVKPDPSRPQGREDVEPQSRARRGSASAGAGRPEGGPLARNASPRAVSTPRPDGLRPPGEEARPLPDERGEQGQSGDTPGERGVPDGSDARGEDPRQSLKQALSDLKSGEYKFQFNNPAYLKGGNFGTMSFDTQDFPWGDYARRIYLIIRNNWYARYPYAASEGGLRGRVCQHIVIERDGTISTIETLRPSGVAPFDRASKDALTASSPLPELPRDFPQPREGVTFCFYYNMIPGEEED